MVQLDSVFKYNNVIPCGKLIGLLLSPPPSISFLNLLLVFTKKYRESARLPCNGNHFF